uniref:Uncharacterized protein n=1 Tax=Arundo donax TaxID=35708 RepID=A0A0A9TI18_ARUDO
MKNFYLLLPKPFSPVSLRTPGRITLGTQAVCFRSNNSTAQLIPLFV